MFNQGCQLDLTVPGHPNLGIPVASLNLFDTLIIVLVIPLLDRVVYPAIERRTRRQRLQRRERRMASGNSGGEGREAEDDEEGEEEEGGMATLSKIKLGFVFACFSMLAAAGVEAVRLQRYKRGLVGGPSVCYTPAAAAAVGGGGEDESDPEYVSMSVLWQIPQFLLVGISEVLAAVPAIEHFYKSSPPNMRSVCAALNLVTTALGTWFSAFLVAGINSVCSAVGGKQWVTRDANQGRLDLFFLLSAAMMGLNSLLLLRLTKKKNKPGLAAANRE